MQYFTDRGAKMIVSKQPWDRVALALSGAAAQRPVLDRTGAPGVYSFVLSWNQPEIGVSIFDALQEQLGLKLESRKAELEFFVVDSSRKSPTEN
jgi:uncharacterized protein (TIGR03435 family)